MLLQARHPAGAPSGRRGGGVFLLVLLVAALVGLGILVGALLGRPRTAALLLLLLLLYDLAAAGFLLGAAASQLRLRRSLRRRGGPPPSLAVVIPSWNGGEGLAGALEALLAQRDRPEEIVLCDDGSDDGSIEAVCERHRVRFPAGGELGRSRRHPHLRVLRKPHSGKADTLNRGIACTGADVVITLDADTRLLPGAIAAVRRGFADHPGTDAIGGVLIPVCTGGLRGRLFGFFQRYEYIRGHSWRLAWNRFDATLLIAGACGAFRRDLLEAVGGFDPASWTEDYEVMFRLHQMRRRQGRRLRVLLEPGFLAFTEAPETIPAWLRQRRRWIGGALETLLRHRAMVGDRRLGPLGCLQLVHNTLLLPQPIWLAAVVPLGWLVGGVGFLPSILGLVAPLLLGRYLLNLLFALARLRLYRRDVGPRGSAYAGVLADALLAPLTYACLQLPAHLWGYASALLRRRGW